MKNIIGDRGRDLDAGRSGNRQGGTCAPGWWDHARGVAMGRRSRRFSVRAGNGDLYTCGDPERSKTDAWGADWKWRITERDSDTGVDADRGGVGAADGSRPWNWRKVARGDPITRRCMRAV